MGVLGGAALGGLFFLWIAGFRVIDPTQFEWLMKLDWRINFLGWHLFRNDPWRIPPGLIDSYLAGEGTTIGFTDSVPLAALLFKPFDAWLPTPFQYFGLWLLLCFALQGLFGALLTRIWTRNLWLQLAGAGMFVLVPTLLIRVGHPALTAHWLLLWALWVVAGSSRQTPPSPVSQAALGLCAGLTHPYLAAMTLAMLVSVPLRDRTLRSALSLAGALVATIVGWWLGGFLSVSNATDLSAGGLGLYSMNLLSPITPQGWSAMMPAQPVAHELQAYEGFQYLGVGVLVLLGTAAALLVFVRRHPPYSAYWPIAAVCGLCALYALSPRVTLGSAVVFDWSSPLIDRVAFFRASGRFFWPMTYLLLTGAIAVVVTRLRAVAAVAMLTTVIALQVIDLRPGHAERRAVSRSAAFHEWPRQLLSPAWGVLLSHYDRVVLVPASQCGGAPLEHEELAFLAGMHGLTINSGLGARWDEASRRRHCGALEVAIAEGRIDDRAVYVVATAHEQRLRAAARQPVACGSIDVARVCVSAASYRAWRDRVPLLSE
jgi:hypothetical protein